MNLVVFSDGQRNLTSHPSTLLIPHGTEVSQIINLDSLPKEDRDKILNHLDNDSVVNPILAKVDKAVSMEIGEP